jgi:hypothetical protein
MQRRNEETEGAGELPAPLKIFKHYLLWLICVKPQAIKTLYLISCGTSTVVVPVEWFPASSVVKAVMVYSLPSISVPSRQDSSGIAFPNPETVIL